MTKIELTEQISEKTNLQKKEVERALETIISLTLSALMDGEKVSLTGLGTFVVIDKKARVARNPKTGETVQVPAKKYPKFKAGKALKGLLSAGEVRAYKVTK